MTKILVVEDNEMNREMLIRRLSKHQFDVIAATDGEDAIHGAEAGSPDLILMDMSLPVIDGWEATRRLKSSRLTKNIPIIGLSAHAMQTDVEKARQAGCDDYDTKPVNMERLLKKINNLLNI
ncbi:MAG: response regulator [Gammaproteobacteria bacterium]|nr:response regulator [Gammaproteobacteria bacterium]MDH5650939.1 response regulator [Gammaproteobacteria bacterium]